MVSPDVSRNVPVISWPPAAIVESTRKLGDTVTKGQLLMRVQSADHFGRILRLSPGRGRRGAGARATRPRQVLLDKGAIAQKDVEVAQDAEAKAKVDVETAQEHCGCWART